MRIVFFGTPQFALPTLKALHASAHEIALVVCRPDAPAKRGLKLLPCPVKSVAAELGLPVVSYTSLSDPNAHALLSAIAPDLIVVVAYGLLVPQKIIEVARLFCLNTHPSLLPRYRGAAPIPWAILNGDRYTGVSIIKLIRQLDAGPILHQRSIEIGAEETASELTDRLSLVAAQTLLESLEQIENKTFRLVPQEESQVIWARKLEKEDGLINWDESGRQIANRIRALQPWPGTYSFLSGKQIKIVRARFADSSQEGSLPGTVVRVTQQGIFVKVYDGLLSLTEVQLANKNVMKGSEFARGFRLSPGARFGSK